MNADNYINIQGWMRTDLDLKGNELLVYAIIYGFSQTENQKFTGSLQYLADWCGATKQGILKNLKSLIDKGLIEKTDVVINGVKYCEYSCIVLNSVEYPIKQSLINNIANNKEDKTILSKDNIVANFEFGVKKSQSTKTKKPSMYDKCIAMINEYTDDVILQGLLVASLKLFLENSREGGIPFYTNTFKGKLNSLRKLSDDDYKLRFIVQQTLDNGWNNFYEIKQNSKRRTNNFAEDVEHLSGGLNQKAKKGGIKSEQKF